MVTVIEHGLVVTVDDETTIVEDGRIVIDGDRIADIGKAGAPLPAGAEVIDARGHTVVPGLFNLHDHISRKSMRLATGSAGYAQQSHTLMAEPGEFLAFHAARNLSEQLASGVTFIRDFGLSGTVALQAVRALAQGVIAGPRLETSGDPICITGGHTSAWGTVEADGPEAITRAVRAQVKRGARVIKFMGSGGLGTFPEEEPGIAEFTAEEIAAGVRAAHDRGVPASVHAYGAEAIERAVRAGADTIEHGPFLTEGLVPLMLEHGTAFVPTLSSVAGISWQHRIAGHDHLARRIEDEIIGPHREAVRMAWRAGVPVVTGTDTNGEVVEELELIAAATGATWDEVLPAATRTAARVAGAAGGVLAVGAPADLLVVRGDIRDEGIPVLYRPTTVFRDGRPFAGAPLPLGIRRRELAAGPAPSRTEQSNP